MEGGKGGTEPPLLSSGDCPGQRKKATAAPGRSPWDGEARAGDVLGVLPGRGEGPTLTLREALWGWKDPWGEGDGQTQGAGPQTSESPGPEGLRLHQAPRWRRCRRLGSPCERL